MTKFNKILKGLTTGVALVALASSSVLAQDDTELTLTVTAGQLTVTSPETAALSGVTIASTDQTATAAVSGVNVVDLRGSNAGWSLTVKVDNLALGTPDANDNILMANQTTDVIATGTSYLALTNSALSLVTGAPETELELTANPTFDTLSTLDNTGETAAMTILVAEVNEGAGDYTFDTAVDITVPAYGDYDITDKKIGGGDYSGFLTYDFL